MKQRKYVCMFIVLISMSNFSHGLSFSVRDKIDKAKTFLRSNWQCFRSGKGQNCTPAKKRRLRAAASFLVAAGVSLVALVAKSYTSEKEREKKNLQEQEEKNLQEWERKEKERIEKAEQGMTEHEKRTSREQRLRAQEYEWQSQQLNIEERIKEEPEWKKKLGIEDQLKYY